MEDRLRQERLAEAAATKKNNEPWYSSVVTWLVGLLILAAAGAGWWFSRRRIADEFLLDTEEQQLREIKDEAEEVLRVLKEPDAPIAPVDKTKDKAGETKSGPDTAEKSTGGNKSFKAGEGNARVLDEESSDPEIQLDLARAYISMGDKEAARVILEEVGNNGTEEQQLEANKMLKLLVP
jgi:FimV-like protein